MNNQNSFVIKIVICFLVLLGNIYAQLAAFPGAEGYGKFTSGGRGGKIIEVTNLNDDGPGSLRYAVEQEGTRTVVFRISGNIELQSDLIIKKGDLTVAGQTAPGDGICVKNYQTTVNANNVIIRFMRFRMGDEKKQASDALSVMNCRNVIVDHCSLSWGIDEVFSFYDNENTTMQWCIVSEALHDSFHPKGKHGYGGIWGGKNASFHHNLIAHNASRNPRFNGSRTKYTPAEEKVDFRNNVIYNWGFNSSYGGENASYNIIANYYKAGPGTERDVRSRIIDPWDHKGKWYVNDNFINGFPGVTCDNWNGGVQGDNSKLTSIRSEKPFDVDNVVTDSPEEAFWKVLVNAGAILPIRDNTDRRIISEVRNGTVHSGNGIINSQKHVGGWPELQIAEAPPDTDKDGIPDNWETDKKLNPNNQQDSSILSENGYTFLEVYLNEISETR